MKGKEMRIEEKLTLEVRDLMKKEIEASGGNEVFFRGIPNEEGIVDEVKVLARGNKYSVPAILKAMKKEEVIIHNHPSGYLFPSDADIEIASIYSNKMSGGSYIVNNKVDDIYIIVELYQEKNISIDIGPYFEKKGVLSRVFPEFEYRKEQLHMAKHIENGLNIEKKVIVEAGTGTGKTLAYLIPSIEWSLKNKKRVVITTNTINLQEQLLNKDIPIAKKVIDGDFKYTLVKGRGNYLCNRKLHNMAMGEVVDFSEMSLIQKNQFKEIISWGGYTDTGDKAELTFEVDGNVWEHFQSESDMCMGNKCPFKEECFFLKARDEKKRADILITNHHMYFSDLAIRKEIGFDSEYSILPEYGLAVFDEAHNIEKVARDYFSYEVSKYGFTKVMNQIYATDGKKRKKGSGSLDILINYLKGIGNYYDKENIEKELENDIKLKHKNLFKSGQDFFNGLIEIFSKGQMGSLSLRLRKETNFTEKFEILKDNFIVEFISYLKGVYKILKNIKEVEDKEGYITEFTRYIERLNTFLENFKFINDLGDEKYIYWVEVNGRKNNSKLVATPLKIDDELSKHLYENLKEIVFTSATIAIGDSFKYFKESIGLKEETLDKVIHSPFDYDHQMKVYLPKDIPDPSDRSFADGIKGFLVDILEKSKGKTFLLFTSYSALNYMYYMVRDELEEKGMELFVQGMAPRTQLVNMYKCGKNPVLFGTDSFWEGVDIKGEQLSSVIIIKLPFKVPSDPVTEAIIENYSKQNKNAFIEYQIPESVIKFKQGIGRLIRSKSDRGIVTILDTRVINKKYGKYFIDAIPTKNIKVLNRKEIIEDISIELED